MGVLNRVADLVQKGLVLGLVSFAGFQVYQIASKVSEGQVDSPYMHSTYFKDVEEKVKEE